MSVKTDHRFLSQKIIFPHIVCMTHTYPAYVWTICGIFSNEAFFWILTLFRFAVWRGYSMRNEPENIGFSSLDYSQGTGLFQKLSPAQWRTNHHLSTSHTFIWVWPIWSTSQKRWKLPVFSIHAHCDNWSTLNENISNAAPNWYKRYVPVKRAYPYVYKTAINSVTHWNGGIWGRPEVCWYSVWQSSLPFVNLCRFHA